VNVSPDFKNARVYVSVIGGPGVEGEVLAGLQSAAGFIRSELMKVLHLRPMPVFEFEIDRSLERGSHTLDILERIRHEHEDDGPVAGPGD
jgi:ribosome-binding factor A